MIQKRLEDVEKRYVELSELLSRPEVLADQETYQKYMKEHASLSLLVEAYRDLKKTDSELSDNRGILEGKDADLRELAKEEIPGLQKRKEELLGKIRVMLLPKDPNEHIP